eukprot:1158374-Pelagomonas_calceolata.AAC.3
MSPHPHTPSVHVRCWPKPLGMPCCFFGLPRTQGCSAHRCLPLQVPAPSNQPLGWLADGAHAVGGCGLAPSHLLLLLASWPARPRCWLRLWHFAGADPRLSARVLRSAPPFVRACWCWWLGVGLLSEGSDGVQGSVGEQLEMCFGQIAGAAGAHAGTGVAACGVAVCMGLVAESRTWRGQRYEVMHPGGLEVAGSQGSRESRGEGLGRCAESRGGLVGQTQLSCPHRQVQLCYHFLSSPPLAQVLLKRLLKGTVGGWLMEGAAERGCWSSVCCGAGVVRGVFGLKDCRGLRGLTTAELAMLLTHAGCMTEVRVAWRFLAR